MTGLRHDGDPDIEADRSFHVMFRPMGTGQGGSVLSNDVLHGDDGPEVLTTTRT